MTAKEKAQAKRARKAERNLKLAALGALKLLKRD